ncbi:Flp pilus assembly complex ATPase component TadA [Paraburkholderia fungorum]|uniref:Flp pilus assembly complex ATPase component TadA n=1 Tax=Paraburkholderia fungorum TaxID=134537 RepID=UPI000697A78A|nr:Flp pilus assembly complex ATPase component TadA [Paraburkholderia fungorum]
MPSIILSSAQVHYFKRAARAQFPQVKNSHLLEALARGFSFDTWAALITALRGASMEAPLSAIFTRDHATARLVELGYPEIANHPLVLPPTPHGTCDASSGHNEHRFHMLNALAERGLFNAEQHATIRNLADTPHTIMVAGATGTGKSTLMRAIIEVQARCHPSHRIGLYQDVREFADYPSNVVEFLPGPSEAALDPDTRFYATLDGAWDSAADYDTLCIDDMRHPVYSTIVLESWKVSRYGSATIHAAPGRCLERVAALTEDLRAGSLAQAIDACVYMEHKDGKPSVHSIEIFNGVAAIPN